MLTDNFKTEETRRQRRKRRLQAATEQLERRFLLSTVTVVITSCGTYPGPDTTGTTVYVDANNNGTLDSGEDSQSSTDRSLDRSFTYFDSSTTQTYRVIPPSGFVVSGSDSATVDGSAGDQYAYIDIEPMVFTSAKVYNDANFNGSYDSGEDLESGWTVFIDSNNNGTLDTGETSTTTDGSGQFSLTAASTQSIVAVPPSGWTGGSTSGGGGDIAVHPLFDITGTVFNDLNADGSGAGEPGVSGGASWQIYEDTNDDGQFQSYEPHTTVQSDGSYSLDIAPDNGCHNIRLSYPSGWRVTNPTDDLQLVDESGTHCGINFDAALIRVPPANLAATAASSTETDLTWVNRDSGTETGTKIYRSVDNASFSLLHTITSAGATSYADTTVSSGHDYQYKVAFYDAGGNSDYSNIADAAAPPAPSISEDRAMLGSVLLKWTPGSGTPSGTTYDVYYGSAPDGVSSALATGITGTTYTDTTVTGGQTVYYRIVAEHTSSSVTSYSSGANDTSGANLIPTASGVVTYFVAFNLPAFASTDFSTNTTSSFSFAVPTYDGTGTVSGSPTASFTYTDVAAYYDFVGGGLGYADWYINSDADFDSAALGTTSSTSAQASAASGSGSFSAATSGTLTFYNHVHISGSSHAFILASLNGVYQITYIVV